MVTAMQQLGKYIPMVRNMHTTEELVKVVFYMQCPLNFYKEDQQDQDSQSSLAASLPEL
jgi:chitinase